MRTVPGTSPSSSSSFLFCDPERHFVRGGDKLFDRWRHRGFQSVTEGAVAGTGADGWTVGDHPPRTT